jgi:N-sulfoglucosamine sulfohydrolase
VRSLIKMILFGSLLLFGLGQSAVVAATGERPNILLLTVDDMNCDSIGAFGCKVAGTTPNIDRLASQGMKFERAHVTIAVCQPCRNTWLCGRYPHRSGGEGFHSLRFEDVPATPELLHDAGYLVGLIGKNGHCKPHPSFTWDFDRPGPGGGRDPAGYGEQVKLFLEQAKQAGKPFFLMANSHDPHRPFYGNDSRFKYEVPGGPAVPSRVFKPEEVVVPGFLPDIPEVRREIGEYYSSVRRADDTVGAILKALEDSGMAEQTAVVFLSDHGMALPFAKTNCYYHSTRTPWIVRWPGKVASGSVDSEHLISGVDVTPTLLNIAGLESPAGVDGRTIVPLLDGKSQEDRDMVFTQFHQTSGRNRYPMRAVTTKKFLYIYNPWADGARRFKNESQAGRTMNAMLAAAPESKDIADRCQLFLYRTPEELYDLTLDPDATVNLIGAPQYAADAKRLKTALQDWMRETKDPALTPFDHLGDEAARAEFMRQQDEAARAGVKPKRNPAKRNPAKRNPNRPRKSAVGRAEN